MSIIRMSRIRAITAAVAATFVLAACGSSGSTPETTVPEVSIRIVSLSPTATEMLYAIGAGDRGAVAERVIEVDHQRAVGLMH